LTKGGLDAATRSLAIEYAGRGIRVNAVSPGEIDTSANAHPSANAVPHIGRVEDVVSAVMYLERAPYVTGEILHVDGGRSAGCWS